MITNFTHPQPKAIGLTPKTCCKQSIKRITAKGAKKIKLFLLLAIQVLVMQASAQVVTVTGNAAGTYGSLQLAFAALPATLTANTVVTLNAGNPQTSPVGGYSITTTGTASFSLTINGSNNTITAPAQTAGSVNDAIFKIIGGDYITIQGFTMRERVFTPGAADIAAATNTMTEWGMALLSSSTTNGAQNNTIRNNTISLNRSYSNTFGIYSNTTHIATNVTSAQTPSVASGTNSNNRVYANSISNVNYGIVFISPGSFATITNMDSGNDIGGASSSTGNTISNCGGVVSATSFNGRMSVPYCILMSGQSNFNLSYNSITSASFSSTFAFGIYITGTPSNGSNTYAQNITNNTITMTMTGAAGQYNSFQGICHEGLQGTLPNVTVNITNNTLLNCQSAANFYGITTSSFAAGTLNINGNIIRGTTLTGTSGDFVGIASSTTGAVTHNINNNQFGTAASPLVTFSAASATSGAVKCVNFEAISNTGSVNIQNNNVRGIVHNVAGTGAHRYFDIPSSTTPRNLNVSGNTFTNLSVNTSGSITFFWNDYLMPVNGTQVYNNNSIVGTFTKSVGSGNVNIFYHSPFPYRAVNQVGTFTYTNNNFRNIVCSGTTTITGIINTDRGSKIINNNTFRNWRAPAGITCINVSGFLGTNNTSNSISSNTLDSLASNAFTSIILGQTTLTPATAVLSVENNTISRIFTSGSFTGFSSSALFNTLNINNNSISGVQLSGATSAFTGISSTGVVSAALNINNNQFGTVSTNLVTFSVASSGNLNCVTISGNAPASTYTIQNNDVRGIVHSTAGTGAHTYYSCAAPLNLNVNGNTFTNLSANTSGAITFFSTPNALPSFGGYIFNNNSIVGSFNKSAANGAITVFSHTGSSATSAGIDHNNNSFRNIVCSGNSAITGINSTDPSTKQINNNTFGNWQAGSGAVIGINLSNIGSVVNTINGNNIDLITTSGNITGISIGNSGSSVQPVNVINNTIGGLTTSGTGTVTGISNTHGQASTININNNSIGPISTAGTSVSITGISATGALAKHNIFANKIFDLNSTSTAAAAVVTGILASNNTSDPTTINNIYNNRIGNLSASASPNSNAVIGLNISSAIAGPVCNVYYNTIYLNNLTGGSTFGASGIYANTNPTLTLNNNLVRITGTAAGTNGRIVAYRRAGVGLSTYSTSSNNNMFYAGTPSATNLIYVEGIVATFNNPQQTLAAYKIYMVNPRDGASTTAASASVPSFLSTTGSSADFLKLNQTNVSDVENVGLTISGYSVDFEADSRNNPPDIGADEICVSPGVPTGLTSQTRCGGNGTVTFTVADPGVGNTIEWSNNAVTANGSTGLSYSPTVIVGNTTNVYARAVTTASGCRSAWTSVVTGIAYNDPTATAGAALTAICQGATSSTMGGSVGGGAIGGTWSGGAGSWTNANNPIAATYTAGASESGSITLTLTTSGGSCGTTTATKTITVNLSPTANAGTALTICQGASSAAMGGSVGGGATGGTWTGGVGVWTNATNPSTATYLASASESGSITLTLTTSGGSCGITTTTKTITVNPSPQGSISGSTICLGNQAQYTFTATTGTGPYSLIIGGTTYNNVVSGTPFNGPSPISTTSYTLTSITDANGCIRTTGFTGATATVTVNPSPQGSISGNTVCLGGQSQFTYTATTGTGPYSLIIGGSTYNSVVSGTAFNGPSPSSTTSYTLTSITDANGCVRTTGITGASATLTVNTAPSITSQPSIPAATCNGSGTQTLTVAATGTGLTYSWRKGGVAVTNGGVFSGQGTNALTLTNPLVADAGSYDVVISGTCPSPVTSSAITVSVNPLPQGSISGSTICLGNQDQFTFTATTGTGPYSLIIGGTTYNNVVSGTPFNGPSPSSTTSYTLTSITDANGCIRTTGFTGATATITVNTAPSIITQPAAPTATCTGTGTQTITVAATGTGLTYSWRKSGIALSNGGIFSGQGTNTLTLTNPLVADAGSYDVVISGTCTPSVTSNAVSVDVSATPIASAGGSQTICQNGTATVPSATATNGAILWTHNGSGQFADDGTGNPGATSTLLTPTYVAAAGDGGFTRTLTLTVSNAPCPNATATHSVVVKAIPTAFAGSNGSICQNGTFTVTGSSSSNGTRVWTHNGAGSFNGGNATSTLLAPTYTAAAGDAGNTVVLTLTVSNSPCSDAVSTTNVSVGSLPTAVVSGSAPHAISCGTGSVAVSGASAANNSSVSWSYSAAVGSSANGTLLNENTLTPTYVCDPTDFGTIILTMTAFATAPCATNATATFVINVKPRPTVAVTLGPNAICNDGNGVARKLTVSNSEANTTYLWSPATDLYIDAAYTIPYTNQNVTEVWSVPFVTTSYTVTATNNTSLCTTPASLPTTLTVCNNLTDVICGATDIAVNSTGAWTNITLIGSTASAGNPCAVVERDVYRRVQVPASGELHVTTAAGTNSTASLNIQRTLVSIHYAPGGTCTTSPSIACNSTGAAGNHSYVYATGLTPGEYAWIRIAKAKANLSDPNTVAQELRINVAPGLTWTGTASTAFTNASNWLNGDATSVTVPDASKSVLISQVTNAPMVSSNEQIRGLIMSSGATLSINTANTLSISRYLQTVNNTVGGLGWTVLNGSLAQTINTTVRFNNLRVNNAAGVNITAATRVGGLDLQQGVVTTNNNLTLLSDAALTGYVNNFSTGYTGSLSGNLNVERRVVLASATASVDHYLASPVDMVGSVFSNYNDDLPVVGSPANYVFNSNPNFTQPSTFPSTWTWDETLTNSNTPGWTGAGGTTLAKGQGFSAKVTSTRIIDISGVANNGSINRTLTYTDNGLNLVGNPYPSPINFNSFATANTSTILPVLYIWNPASNSYASYNGSIWVNNPAGALASDVIGHSQSFFVFAKPSVAPSGTVNFNNTMRTTSQAANFFSAPEGLIRLEVSSNGHTDEAVVMTNAEATENYDEQVDAKKLLNAMNPNILAFTLSADNTPLAINALDKYSAEQIIPVQVIAPTAGEVNIKLNLSDLKDKYENVYLEDATLGTFTDLKAKGSYTATVSSGNSGSRFFLHFEKPSIAKSANELGVYAANSTVFVNIPSQSNGTIEVIDLVGKTIYTSNFSGKSGRVAFEIPNVVYGTYLVKLTSNGKVVNQKVLLTE